MQFHDVRPWRASKMMPSRRPIVTVDFAYKTATGIKFSLVQTVSKHRNHKKRTVKQTKIRHLKIIKINRSDDPPKHRNPTFTKRYRNQQKSSKNNMLTSSKHKKYQYLQGPVTKLEIVTSLDARL